MAKQILILLSIVSEILAAKDYAITKYKFVGYRNVWHNGQDHTSLTVGDFGDFNPDAELDWKKLDDYRRKEIVKLCANQCALYGDVCDAFYVEKKGDGTNCHLVEETSARIIGHGEDTLKVYYIKHQFANASIINTPPALTPPCDQDNIELSEASCTGNSTIPSEGIHYEICEEMEDNFFGTLGKMSDAKCPGEDRIILCELEGGMISNINENTRFNLLNLAFLKTYQNENPYRSIAMDMFQFMELTFPGGPREVKRIIVRSVTDMVVHKLKDGKFTFYQGDKSAELSFTLETDRTCLVHINMAGVDADIKAIADKTDRLRMDVESVHKMTEPVRTAFKIDLFVNELKLEAPESEVTEPDSNGNSTATEP